MVLPPIRWSSIDTGLGVAALDAVLTTRMAPITLQPGGLVSMDGAIIIIIEAMIWFENINRAQTLLTFLSGMDDS